MPILAQLFSIFIFGLIGGANPGPLLFSCCSESLRVGYIKSYKTILWGLIAESIVALAVLIAIFSFEIPQWLFHFIALFGGAFLIYIAWQISQIKSITDDNAKVFTFKKILILTLLNGPFWIFWITICVPMAFEINKLMPGGQWIFLLLFEVGWLVATSLIVFIFSRFRQALTNQKIVGLVYKIMALILLYFALKMIITNIIYFWQLYG